MNSRNKSICFWVAMFFLLQPDLRWASAESERRPNIVVILSDDQGYGDLGIHGNPSIKTPNIDRLASEGVRIKDFYVSPLCSPTRASLLTGRYNHRTGVMWPARGGEVLRPRETTIAEVLKQAGYRTGIVGKWHLGRYNGYGPADQGFDEFFGFRDGMIDDYFDPVLEHNGKPVWTGGYVTDILTERAVKFIESNQSSPFFLYLAYNAPHVPSQAPQKYIENYVKQGLPLSVAKLYGMVSCMDDGIGRVVDALSRLGLEKDTAVFFLSDNGPHMESSTEYQRFMSAESLKYDAMWRGTERFNANLRGEKGNLYEGGIKVPFIARWPAHFAKGRIADAMAAHLDLFPTILELCNIPAPTRLKLDGKSMVSLLRHGEGAALHEKLFFWCDQVEPNRSDRLLYPQVNYAVRSGNWKLVKGKELYDLAQDPGRASESCRPPSANCCGTAKGIRTLG